MKALFFLLIANLAFANTLEKDQWYLKNNGYDFPRKTSELSKNIVKGIPGEDVGLVEIKSDKKVIVAVLDSGIDLNHPDLKDNLWSRDGACVEGDENSTCRGWNFLDNNDNLIDIHGHGTHVAGIIAAKDDSIGVKGIAHKNALIMPLKVWGENLKNLYNGKTPFTSIVAKAIHFALDNGASVINMSIGWPKVIQNKEIEKALSRAYQENVPVVVASGNNAKKTPSYACKHWSVICVGALDNRGEITEFSNTGQKVDIYAPGEYILSTFPINLEPRAFDISGYEVKNGSSQSSPMVAAALALLEAKSGKRSIEEIKQKLFFSSLPADKSYKHGKLNIQKLLGKDIVSVDLNLKKTGDVVLSQKNTFNFKIPYSTNLDNSFSVKVRASSDAVIFEKSLFEIDAKENKVGEFTIKGSLLDLSIDAEIDFTFDINFSDKVVSYKASLFFVKDVRNSLKLGEVPVKGLNPNYIARFVGSKKATALKKIYDSDNISPNYNYFYFNPKRLKEVKDKTPVQILVVNKDEISNVEILNPKVKEFFGVYTSDTNADGIEDFITYGLDKEDNLVIAFYDNKGAKLFDQNVWLLEDVGIDPFEVKNRKEIFKTMSLETDLYGRINVPVFPSNWILPEEDNSFDFFERLVEGSKNRGYYLGPKKVGGKVKATIRSLDSFKNYEKIKESLQLDFSDELDFLSLKDQSRKEKKQGLIKALYLISRYYRDELVEVSFLDGKVHSVTPMELSEFVLQGNSVESIDGKWVFSSSLGRTKIRVFDEESKNTTFDSFEWADRIIRFLTVNKSGYFFETRKNIWFNNGRHNLKLSIDRESSFPGKSFSETFEVVKGESKVVVNSSLVVANKVYVMEYDGERFYRPISKAMDIPKDCIVMDIHKYQDRSYKSFICKRGRGLAFRWLSL